MHLGASEDPHGFSGRVLLRVEPPPPDLLPDLAVVRVIRETPTGPQRQMPNMALRTECRIEQATQYNGAGLQY